nr:hypothetical protein [Evansella caseinilytica]
MNKYVAMSDSSLRNCELSHCAISRDGTWINTSEILAEEETPLHLFRPAVSGFLRVRMTTFRCYSQDVSGT